ncbi:thioesterase domain-containing protein [Oceaniferula spumae]
MEQTYSQSEKVIALNVDGGNVPIFLIHGVKGQAYISPHFIQILGEDQPVYAFQASGLQRPKKRHCTIEEMASQYIAAMRKVRTRGPYVIGAIAIGSVVAIEMAQQLTAHGEDVAPLLLIDPPVAPPGERSWFRRVRRGVVDRIRRKFSEEKLNRQLENDFRRISAAERIALDMTNQEAVEIACRVAYDFRLALNDYQLKPFTGDVFLLGSRGRLSKGGRLRAKLKGKVEIFDIGETHDEIHDVNNDRFAQQLRISVDAIMAQL